MRASGSSLRCGRSIRWRASPSNSSRAGRASRRLLRSMSSRSRRPRRPQRAQQGGLWHRGGTVCLVRHPDSGHRPGLDRPGAQGEYIAVSQLEAYSVFLDRAHRVFARVIQGHVSAPTLLSCHCPSASLDSMWMTRTYPHISFERYADDIICHCKSAEDARALWSALADRFWADCTPNISGRKL
jgi:hypothetical protein